MKSPLEAISPRQRALFRRFADWRARLTRVSREGSQLEPMARRRVIKKANLVNVFA